MKDVRSAGTIVYSGSRRNPRYLVIQYRKARHWDFPRGHVEKGETDLEAAKRELKEETGISQAHFVKGFHAKTSWKLPKPDRSGATHKIVVFFLCESRSKRVHLSHEHMHFAWLPIEPAWRKITFPNMREVLEKAHVFLQTHSSQ